MNSKECPVKTFSPVDGRRFGFRRRHPRAGRGRPAGRRLPGEVGQPDAAQRSGGAQQEQAAGSIRESSFSSSDRV